MMEIIKPGTKIDFVGKTKIFFAASAIAMLICLALILFKGFNLGIDFAGGTLIQVKFTNPVPLDDIREGLRPVISNDFAIQNFGEPNEVLIRIGEYSGTSLQELSDNVKDQLNNTFAVESPVIQRVEQVGPQVGDELRKKAFLAMLYASLGILIYVAIRFEFIFAIGAILSLLHDVIFTMGIYSLAGKEFNLTVMAAILTVAGYSLNDTIVVFDRIREKLRSGVLEQFSWKEVVNMSINETLSRTILTSVLTFLAVFSLYIFGGEVINGFALIMMIGIIVGTYSSIGIAAMFVYWVKARRPQELKVAAKAR